MRDRLVGIHAARAKRGQHAFVVGARKLLGGIALPALGEMLKDQPRPSDVASSEEALRPPQQYRRIRRHGRIDRGARVRHLLEES